MSKIIPFEAYCRAACKTGFRFLPVDWPTPVGKTHTKRNDSIDPTVILHAFSLIWTITVTPSSRPTTKIPSKIGTRFYGNDGKTHKSGKKLFKKYNCK
jgi:hypothetical protein